jgi:hypothetical protein
MLPHRRSDNSQNLANRRMRELRKNTVAASVERVNYLRHGDLSTATLDGSYRAVYCSLARCAHPETTCRTHIALSASTALVYMAQVEAGALCRAALQLQLPTRIPPEWCPQQDASLRPPLSTDTVTQLRTCRVARRNRKFLKIEERESILDRAMAASPDTFPLALWLGRRDT